MSAPQFAKTWDEFSDSDEQAMEEPSAAYSPNDDGRARQFIDHNLADVRFVPAWDTWFVWGGHRWERDISGLIPRKVVELSRELIDKANRLNDTDARGTAMKRALALGDAKTITSTLGVAKTDPRIILDHKLIDADPFLLGVKNGVIDLRTGVFRDGKRDDYITKEAGVSYDGTAKCERWRTFINEITAGNAPLAEYLQKWVGYMLTGSTQEQCFAFLHGGGRNGKSTFLNIIASLMGNYAQKAPPSLFMTSRNGSEPSNEIARLCGARMVIGSEVDEENRLAESRIKDMTGGDTLTGRRLYESAFDFEPTHKLLMFGNHKPEIRGGDDGIWRRVRLIPFIVQFTGNQCDPNLIETLKSELPGILNWAIEGTLLWKNEGLGMPEEVATASDGYRRDEDSLGEFIEEVTVEAKGKKLDCHELYQAYQDWALLNGVRLPMKQNSLTKKLTDRNWVRSRTATGGYWRDRQLRSAGDCHLRPADGCHVVSFRQTV